MLSILRNFKGRLWLKLHPFARLEYWKEVASHPAILDFESKYGRDLTVVLPCFDLLVSDYSSCIYDFLLIRDKAISFLPDELPLDDICYVHPKLIPGVEFFTKGEELARYLQDFSPYRSGTGSIKCRNFDGRACERIFNEVFARLHPNVQNRRNDRH